MLPACMQVFERGWLSSNNILFHPTRSMPEGATLIDSGYGAHAEQTLALVEHGLQGGALARLLNTHCHSDHMGGNAALRARYACRIGIPIGEVPLIERWDEEALMLTYADQACERFGYDDQLAPGDVLKIAELDWQVHAAPGHDRHALMFFNPDERLLVSGDALWENGFGVIFPALFGDAAGFHETRATLDTIAKLGPKTVIPGHGAVFSDVDAALERAHARLEGYVQSPERLARHCAKVMLSFALMDKRRMPRADVAGYVERVGILRDLNQRFFGLTPQAFGDALVRDLERAGALKCEGGAIFPKE